MLAFGGGEHLYTPGLPGMLWENQVQRNRNRQNLYVFGVYGFGDAKSRNFPGCGEPALTLFRQTTYTLVVFSHETRFAAKGCGSLLHLGCKFLITKGVSRLTGVERGGDGRARSVPKIIYFLSISKVVNVSLAGEIPNRPSITRNPPNMIPNRIDMPPSAAARITIPSNMSPAFSVFLFGFS